MELNDKLWMGVTLTGHLRLFRPAGIIAGLSEASNIS